MSSMTGAVETPSETDAGGRPRQALPLSHLLRISAYWLGLTAIDAGVNIVIQNQVLFGGLVPELEVGRTIFLIGIGGTILGIVVQPTVGAISDYTVSRWGRRKPWIVIGSLLDLVFLAGIAYSNTVLSIATFVLLLAFSTNIARGPFQGYVPDLVPAKQVGFASAMVGLMQILGNVVGFAIATVAAVLTGASRADAAATGGEPANYLPLALVAIALVELVTMASVVLKVGNGQPPRPREGRSWPAIARAAWATDILSERSYVWLVASRLFFLTGGSILFNFILTYMAFTLALGQEAANTMNLYLLAIILVANIIAIVPAARLSDRYGRKPVIYGSCAIGAVGVTIVAASPNVVIAAAGAALYGASAGMFLSVDWALMTDIIPKAAAGRYMGLSNVATGAASALGPGIGGLVLDFVNRSRGTLTDGPRAAFAVALILYVIAILLFRPVTEPGRSTPAEPELARA
jgi:MFS family permease